MEEIMFKKGLLSRLPKLEERKRGTFYVVEDEKQIYLDDMVIDDTNKILSKVSDDLSKNYLHLSGGTVSGDTKFDNDVTIDGNLTVQGPVSVETSITVSGNVTSVYGMFTAKAANFTSLSAGTKPVATQEFVLQNFATNELVGIPTDEDKTNTILGRLKLLEKTVDGDNDTVGLKKIVENLIDDEDVEGSIDYNINKAFNWIYLTIEGETES